MDNTRFDGKVAVVTGAAQGIGEAYARALAAEGAAVVVADVNEEAGTTVAKQIVEDGGRALFVHTDVSSPESAEAMATTTVEQFGGIDLLVNNAAIYGGMRIDLLLTVDWDYYKKFMSVNMDGALVCTRAVFPHMQQRGGGAIVNQSSTAAWLYSGFYGLAKVAMNGLTQQLAHELGGMGIRVNAIAPDVTDSLQVPYDRLVPAEERHLWPSWVPIGRMGVPGHGGEAGLDVVGVGVTHRPDDCQPVHDAGAARQEFADRNPQSRVQGRITGCSPRRQRLQYRKLRQRPRRRKLRRNRLLLRTSPRQRQR